MARPERFELPTNWFEASYSIQLSYGRVAAHLNAFNRRGHEAYAWGNRQLMSKPFTRSHIQRRLPVLLPLWLLLSFALPAGAVPGAGVAAVATPEPHATAAALAVLDRGGNAVDAATAVAFVLAVTQPEAGNIGGGGFMTLYVDGQPAFLDYRETAPAAADRDMYLDAQGEPLPDASITGHRAVGTPGTVAGLWAAHKRYGRLPWPALVEPAIALA